MLALYSETDDHISDAKIERVRACSGAIKSRNRLTRIQNDEMSFSKSVASVINTSQARNTDTSLLPKSKSRKPSQIEKPSTQVYVKPMVQFEKTPEEVAAFKKEEKTIRSPNRKVTSSRLLKNPIETSYRMSPRKKKSIVKNLKKNTGDNTVSWKESKAEPMVSTKRNLSSSVGKVRIVGPRYRVGFYRILMVVGLVLVLKNLCEGALFYTYGLHGKQVMNMIRVYAEQAHIWIVNMEILRGLARCIGDENEEVELIGGKENIIFTDERIQYLKNDLINRIESYTRVDLGEASSMFFDLVNTKDYCELSSNLFPKEYPDCSLEKYSHIRGPLITVLKSHAAQFDRITDFMWRNPKNNQTVKILMNESDVTEYLPYSLNENIMTDTFSVIIKNTISPMIDKLLKSSARLVAKKVYLFLGMPTMMVILALIFKFCQKRVLRRISDYSSSFHFISVTMLLNNPWLQEYLKRHFYILYPNR